MAVDSRYIQNNEKGYRLYVDDAKYEDQLGIGSRKPAFTQNDDVYQQSQFKKPYLEDSYEEMEYFADSLPGFPYDWDYDTPFVDGVNNIGAPGLNPWHVVCFCDTGSACYGDGGFNCTPAQCSWPVTGVAVDSIPPGCSLTLSSGKICGKCPKGEKGTISYHINMRAKFKHNGATVTVNCAHYSQMSSCFEQCDDSGMVYDTAGSIETIGQSDSGGVAITDSTNNANSTYSWSISGTGFWFDAGYTLTSIITTGADLDVTVYTDGTACGSGEITVTGCAGTTVTGYVRCTTGQWVNILNCVATSGSTAGCLPSTQVTVGKLRLTYDEGCFRCLNPDGVTCNTPCYPLYSVSNTECHSYFDQYSTQTDCGGGLICFFCAVHTGTVEEWQC